MESWASCGLCSASVPRASLEAHLRVELRYAAWICLSCDFVFFAAADAQTHVDAKRPFSAHPEGGALIAERRNADTEARLYSLMHADAKEDGGGDDDAPPMKRPRIVERLTSDCVQSTAPSDTKTWAEVEEVSLPFPYERDESCRADDAENSERMEDIVPFPPLDPSAPAPELAWMPSTHRYGGMEALKYAQIMDFHTEQKVPVDSNNQSNFRRDAKTFVVRDGELFFIGSSKLKGKMPPQRVLRKGEVVDIVRSRHVANGHSRINKLRKEVSDLFWMPRTADIRAVVASCADCASRARPSFWL